MLHSWGKIVRHDLLPPNIVITSKWITLRWIKICIEQTWDTCTLLVGNRSLWRPKHKKGIKIEGRETG